MKETHQDHKDKLEDTIEGKALHVMCEDLWTPQMRHEVGEWDIVEAVRSYHQWCLDQLAEEWKQQGVVDTKFSVYALCAHASVNTLSRNEMAQLGLIPRSNVGYKLAYRILIRATIPHCGCVWERIAARAHNGMRYFMLDLAAREFPDELRFSTARSRFLEVVSDNPESVLDTLVDLE